ncbi:L-fuculose-phosphate aldolase [Hydrogenivirga caldilitoris]|uniref:L-fuculose-phosphate aldolase n=1 Tax=Hydrogenivirga caldilitoris TaxID=246264 RepID=A0A497XR34_9AQUI|nr:class II aldolase/adducin family protein [Hydrogenivirga caldilitoris]RLJ70724.1 L-fuculose-phosphate aldolase [Hydrogenivirga caldilitoris]
MEWIYKEIIKVGKLLFSEGLVSARSGNISRAFMERLYITRTGSSLGALRKEDIIELPLKETHILDKRASVELSVHKKIIIETERRAVVHAHPVYTLLVSYEKEEVVPVDSEGREILGSVPVLELEKPSASDELAERASSSLKYLPVVIVRGHGVFAAADELYKAYSFISTLEQSCKILFLRGS